MKNLSMRTLQIWVLLLTIDDERNIEECYEALSDEWDRDHPVCPQCGSHMYSMSEQYNLDFPFEDVWLECLTCGYTESK